MLFTTAAFVLLYLPITLFGFFLIGARSQRGAAAWLGLASLFFYGYWMPEFTLLLLASIAANFWIGQRMLRARSGAATQPAAPVARRWLMLGVAFNLGLLGYFKYANFFVANLNAVLGSDWDIGRVILPIGISFYSFTQIAFLVDTCHGKVREASWIHYGLFVTYFPHLIAGPVLHHAQMMPQFAKAAIYRPHAANLTAGVVIFGLGLFKKVVMADGVSPFADAVFKAADQGVSPSPAEAWLGAMAYTLQLYFDFSGYSDMAIGLSWMFNIRLPFNFNSPYRATSISEFWRRWHISLSTFLRDYLYIALGGNRHGTLRRHANLMLTMLLGGLWHGASWSFVMWGGLHGLYLVLNHGFRAALKGPILERLDASWIWGVLAWALTLLSVLVAWVFFRAESFAGALHIVTAMAGRGSPVTEAEILWNAGLSPGRGLLWCGVLGAVTTLRWNSNQMAVKVQAAVQHASLSRSTVATFATLGVAFLVLVNTARDSVSAFIYFNF